MASAREHTSTGEPKLPDMDLNPEKKDVLPEAGPHKEDALDRSITAADREFYEKYGTYDRYEITEEDCYDELGFSFPTWKKWYVYPCIACT